jgi:hypothetical protein
MKKSYQVGLRVPVRTELLADLIYAVHGRIVQEALKMEHENPRKRLEMHLSARLG